MAFDLKKWLSLAGSLAPLVLAATPAAALAPFIGPAIQIAEQIPNAKGADKAKVAQAIVKVAVLAANAQAGKQLVDANSVDAAITEGIEAAVAAVNVAHGVAVQAD